MKKINILIAVILLLSSMAFNACDSDSSKDSKSNEEGTAVTGISLNRANITIQVDNSELLTATIEPADAADQNVTWSTSNGSVASVSSDGLVYGESNGTAIITVTAEDGDFTADCMVTVITEVNIEDPNLEAAIRAQLPSLIDPAAPLTTTDLETLTELDASNSYGASDDIRIDSLAGLEYCINLQELNLSSNNVNNLTPLSGLTDLTVLYLYDNSVSDISALAGLTSLTELSLESTDVSDIDALSGLIGLKRLYANSNNINDISALSGLTNLTHLFLHSNNISDISSLTGLTSLESLYLSNNSISNISVLSGLTALIYLYLTNNSITDITALINNTGLGTGDYVDLQGNTLTDPSQVTTLEGKGVDVDY